MPIYTKTWTSDDGVVELTLAPPEEGSQFCLTLRVENEDDENETEIILATDHKELDEVIGILQQIRAAPIPDSPEEENLEEDDEEEEEEEELDEEADEPDPEPTGK